MSFYPSLFPSFSCCLYLFLLFIDLSFITGTFSFVFLHFILSYPMPSFPNSFLPSFLFTLFVCLFLFFLVFFFFLFLSLFLKKCSRQFTFDRYMYMHSLPINSNFYQCQVQHYTLTSAAVSRPSRASRRHFVTRPSKCSSSPSSGFSPNT